MNRLHNAAGLALYMEQRERIRRARAERPGPWTDNPILRDYRFCNVYREHDRVTVWIRENIREPYAESPHLWFMLAVARYINWPPTLETLINHHKMNGAGTWPSAPNFSISTLRAAMEELMAAGEKVFTGAYMVRSPDTPKVEYVTETVLASLWNAREALRAEVEAADSLESMFRVLHKRYPGWGAFMTYEWVTDLRWTRYLKDAPDLHSWAAYGPGSRRGLNRLARRPLVYAPKESVALDEMRALLTELNAYNNPHFNNLFGPPGDRFEMRDVEHNLCEFDKYMRCYEGGRPRSGFDWRTR